MIFLNSIQDYITFIDPDDYISENLYDQIVQFCNLYDMIWFGYYGENESGKRWGDKNSVSVETVMSHEEMVDKNYPKMLGFSSKDIIRWNHEGNVYQERAKGMVLQYIIKGDIIRKNNIRFKEELIFQEDDIFTMECLVHCNSLISLPSRYYHYVHHPSNVTNTIESEEILNKKFFLLKYKNTIRQMILQKDKIDILEVYAGSNVLSILEIASICAKCKIGYNLVKKYVLIENVKESVKMIRLEFNNYKFNAALLLMKCHLYRMLYWGIAILNYFGIDFSSNFK